MATWFVFFSGCREIRTASTGHCKYSEKHLCGNADTCPVLSTTANSLVSNLIGAGGVSHVMQLMGRIAPYVFYNYGGMCAVLVVFPQAMLSVYTNEEALLIESVPSLYVIGGAMLIASVANIYFQWNFGYRQHTGCFDMETATLVILHLLYLLDRVYCESSRICLFLHRGNYYALIIDCSVIYFEKSKIGRTKSI